MLPLPKGYYAVQADFENAAKDTFVYKGVCYAVQEGVNLFATATEADAAACEVPDVVLEGLDYPSFAAPVLLFSAGMHRIEGLNPVQSRILLGQKAGVNPNLPPQQKGEMPALNPARDVAEEESLLYGASARSGAIRPQENGAELIVMDGFVNRQTRLFDQRAIGEGRYFVAFKNIIYQGPWGKLYHFFANYSAEHQLYREVLFQNIRLDHFDDYGHAGIFAYMSTDKLTIDNFVYNDTEQLFGFTDLAYKMLNAPVGAEHAEIIIKNSYFGNMRGEHGIATNLQQAPERAIHLTVTDTTFVDASREGESPLQPHMPNERCRLTVKNCSFTDTRGNVAAITVRGEGENVEVENCTFEGFDSAWQRVPMAIFEAPAYIEQKNEDWMTDTEDPHCIKGTDEADLSALDACYEGCNAYRGDQHVHTACGGRSDGHFPMSEWVDKMDELDLDFVCIVDHRQMRGFFLPEWNEERFIRGTEPGTGFLEPHNCRHKSGFHYNMLFPHKYGLAMVLANFPEFEFKGDELTGIFSYPRFTRERFLELSEYVHSIGGMMVHAHPKTIMCSDDPLSYYFGEHSYIETVVGGYSSQASFRSHQLWVDILQKGKHVFASVGSDTHRNVSNAAVATFYTKERHADLFFEQMRAGNYTAGAVGIKMCIDGQPMGSELAYREGMELSIRVGDFFPRVWKENTAYELRVYTDRGLAYSSIFDGTQPQSLVMKVQKRAFYRVEVLDLSHHYRIAASNPIWLDKEESAEEGEQA